MSQINDGGPAFPIPLAATTDANHETHVIDAQDRCSGGMSLRDYFAGQALAGLVAKAPLLDAEGEHGPKFDKATLAQFRRDMAVSAYDYADEMLAVRSKT